jgi:solute carrier family 50 (sugar transporter)
VLYLSCSMVMPFVFKLLIRCFSYIHFQWLTYAVLKQDVFIFVGNGPGFLTAIWLNLQAVQLQYDSFRLQETRKSILVALEEARDTTSEFLLRKHENNDNHDDENANFIFSHVRQIVAKVTAPALIPPVYQERLVLANALVWLIVVSIISFAKTFDARTKELIVGIVVNLNLVIFYAAPLSVIYTVVTQRNSASIHACTMITNTFNGTFWAVYGFAVADPFIYVTNGLGAILGVVQILLCLMFPRKIDEEPVITNESTAKIVEKAMPQTSDVQDGVLPK